eukprot:365700-Chlamydomonas_euryale.AAC.11
MTQPPSAAIPLDAGLGDVGTRQLHAGRARGGGGRRWCIACAASSDAWCSGGSCSRRRTASTHKPAKLHTLKGAHSIKDLLISCACCRICSSTVGLL